MADLKVIERLPERVKKTLIWSMGKMDFKELEDLSVEECVTHAEKIHNCIIVFEESGGKIRIKKQ